MCFKASLCVGSRLHLVLGNELHGWGSPPPGVGVQLLAAGLQDRLSLFGLSPQPGASWGRQETAPGPMERPLCGSSALSEAAESWALPRQWGRRRRPPKQAGVMGLTLGLLQQDIVQSFITAYDGSFF